MRATFARSLRDLGHGWRHFVPAVLANALIAGIAAGEVARAPQAARIGLLLVLAPLYVAAATRAAGYAGGSALALAGARSGACIPLLCAVLLACAASAVLTGVGWFIAGERGIVAALALSAALCILAGWRLWPLAALPFVGDGTGWALGARRAPHSVARHADRLARAGVRVVWRAAVRALWRWPAAAQACLVTAGLCGLAASATFALAVLLALGPLVAWWWRHGFGAGSGALLFALSLPWLALVNVHLTAGRLGRLHPAGEDTAPASP